MAKIRETRRSARVVGPPLNLGDLRFLVQQTTELPDSAVVTVHKESTRSGVGEVPAVSIEVGY